MAKIKVTGPAFSLSIFSLLDKAVTKIDPDFGNVSAVNYRASQPWKPRSSRDLDSDKTVREYVVSERLESI